MSESDSPSSDFISTFRREKRPGTIVTLTGDHIVVEEDAHRRKSRGTERSRTFHTREISSGEVRHINIVPDVDETAVHVQNDRQPVQKSVIINHTNILLKAESLASGQVNTTKVDMLGNPLMPYPEAQQISLDLFEEPLPDEQAQHIPPLDMPRALYLPVELSPEDGVFLVDVRDITSSAQAHLPPMHVARLGNFFENRTWKPSQLPLTEL